MSQSPIIVFSTQHMLTGGIESHLQQFCQHLHDKGTKIDLVVVNAEMLPETKKFYQGICRQVFLGNNKTSISRLLWLLLVAIKLSFNKYQAIYTNGQGNSVLYFSKLILFYNTWVHHHHTAGDASDQSGWTNDYRKTLLSSDAVIACSNSNASILTKSLGRSVISIPCFSVEIGLTKSILAHEKPRFGYFGRLIPEKGIDILCKLSEEPELKNIELHIWGEGKKYPAIFFKKFPNLKFHGPFRGAKELSSVIGAIDAFLLLSSHPEGLPVSLLEVMSAGIPWLATDRGGIKDIIIDPISTRILPSTADYNTIKSSVISLAADISAGLISRESQLRLYKEKFSSSAIISQWQQVLGLNEI